MKINNINSNQSFGKLRITSNKRGKRCRDKLFKDIDTTLFQNLDKISGKHNVEINISCHPEKYYTPDGIFPKYYSELTGFVNGELKIATYYPTKEDAYRCARRLITVINKIQDKEPISKYYV